jgi:hypothetical protein
MPLFLLLSNQIRNRTRRMNKEIERMPEQIVLSLHKLLVFQCLGGKIIGTEEADYHPERENSEFQ